MLRILPLLALCTAPGCLLLEEPCDVPDAEENNLLGNGVFDQLTCWYDGDEHDWENSGLRAFEGAPGGSGAPAFGVVSEGEGYGSRRLIQGPYFSDLRSTELGLEDGDRYEITFNARADAQSTMLVGVYTPTVPWSETEIILDTSWETHTTLGTAGGGEAGDAWFEMQFGEDAVEIFIDDVVLRRSP